MFAEAPIASCARPNRASSTKIHTPNPLTQRAQPRALGLAPPLRRAVFEVLDNEHQTLPA